MGNKVCEMVAARVLEELEKGVIPWHQPWFGSDRFVSHTTGKHYSLLNCMLLGKPGEYATFKQIAAEGGHVRKGAKARFIVYWNVINKVETNDDGEEVAKTYPVLRYFNVFNLDDCEGIDKKYLADDDLRFEHDTVAEAEEIIEGYCAANPTLRIVRDQESNRAFYRPSEDLITVPCVEQFKVVEEFYSTLFHEMTHSTGHWSRLGRFKENGAVGFGDEEYSKEELIAELGAAALCLKCGVESRSSFRNSAAYLKGWTDAIKGNPDLIVQAAGKADKAVDLILRGSLATVDDVKEAA